MENEAGRVLRRLGRTGFEVNVLGLGGHTHPVGNGPEFFLSPDDRAHLIHYLVSSGVNYFDTTYKEEVELLADSFRRANIKEDVVISLYGGFISAQQWHQKLRSELESRLAILGYSRAPLFLASVGDGDASYDDIVAACEAMRKFKEEDLVQNIGLSCHAINLFPTIGKVIRETDMIDYIMIRFNWKVQQANEELFPIAEEHDVGIVAMKLFCWDCAPSQWEMKISVFESAGRKDHPENNLSLTPAQRHLVWCIQNSPCDVVVPAMNTLREAKENVQSLGSIGVKVATEEFEDYGARLWNKAELKRLALYAESKTIRERARALWRPRQGLGHLLIRTIKAHYRILRDEGFKKYLLYSYLYRREQISLRIKKIRL
ncbi:MAG TPA: aldo/keto reductase [Thermodesulfovibrionales bacterium]|nr:aldo/keto reductase [Thermodesulfovibrionales bacterium]